MSSNLGASMGELHADLRPESLHLPVDRPAEQPTPDFVCDVCNGVDWPRVAKLQEIYQSQRHPWRIVISSLGSTSAELNASPCKVCRTLSFIKSPTYDGQKCALYSYKGSHGYTQLRVIPQPDGPDARYLHKELDQDVFPSLTVIGSSDDRDLRGMKVQPKKIDAKAYGELKAIMRNCVQSHDQTCRPMSRRSNIPGFKVIEVASGRVMEVSDQCEYLALSYVWKHRHDADDLIAAPAVVTDALWVAEKLGLKYVWVDKYCITSEGAEKQAMLNRMGEIYSNAYCTIIAAAGEDALTGLPGVSRAHRHQQREVNVKGVTLVDFPYSKDHGSALLSSSKWATRGWTYQEGYLSARRLIFTDYRVLYLCNKEFSPEPFKRQESTTSVPTWSSTHHAQEHSFARFVPHAAFSGHRASAANLREQIQEYTRRDLTYPEDSLNAFLGVLDYNSRTSRPMAHLWGLPLYEDQARAPQPRDVLFELFWWHESSPAAACRRRGFPSWSWVGWEGPVRFRTKSRVRAFPEGLRLPPPGHPRGSDVFVTDEGGNQTLLYEYADSLLRGIKTGDLVSSQPGPRTLSVSCHVLPVRMRHFDLSEDQISNEYIMTTQQTSSATINMWSRRPSHPAGGPLAVVQVCSGTYMCVRPWLDQEVEQWGDCFALHFGAAKNTSGLFTHERNLLLVRRASDEVYERVGLIHWHFLDFDQPIFFIDEEGDFMDKVVFPPEEELFCAVAEKSTICLA